MYFVSQIRSGKEKKCVVATCATDRDLRIAKKKTKMKGRTFARDKVSVPSYLHYKLNFNFIIVTEIISCRDVQSGSQNAKGSTCCNNRSKRFSMINSLKDDRICFRKKVEERQQLCKFIAQAGSFRVGSASYIPSRVCVFVLLCIANLDLTAWIFNSTSFRCHSVPFLVGLIGHPEIYVFFSLFLLFSSIW